MFLFHTNWLPSPGHIAQNTLQSHSKQCRDYNEKREHDKHMINYFSFFTLLSFINSCLLNWQDITFVGLFKLRWTLQYAFFSSPQAIQHRKHFSIFIHAQIYFSKTHFKLFNICGTMTIATIVHFSEGCQVFEAKIGTSVFLWVYAQLNSATNTTSPNIFPK